MVSYENHYEDNGVVDATKIEMDQLMDITDEIQDYLFGRRDDFRIRGVVDGEEGQVFNERGDHPHERCNRFV